MTSVPGAAMVLLLASSAAAAAGNDPSAPVVALDTALEHAMATGSQPFPARYAALAPVVDQAFDLPQILKTIVGLRWSGIAEADQKRLLTVFRAYTIASYAANFNAPGAAIRVLPETRDVGADRVVETEIVPKDADPVRIDYVMREKGAGWQAIDVLEAGTISQAAVQRSDFRALLAGGADKLIASLADKVKGFSGGTVTP